MDGMKRKPIWYNVQNASTSRKTWIDIAQEYQGSNCTCGRCVAEVLKRSDYREKGEADEKDNSSIDLPETSSSVYSFGKDDNPTACTCIFCSTYSYTTSCEEVLKEKVTKLGKENIPSCKTKMLHPERKFFRYASVREKRSARAKNEPVCSSIEYSVRNDFDDPEDEERLQETDEWSID